MRKRTLLIVVVLMAALLVSASPGEVIPVGDRFYDIIDSLFILNGQAIPSGTRPWTKAEAINELSLLDRSGLTGAALGLYDELDAYLAVDRNPSVSVGAAVNPEIYVHTDREFSTEELRPVDYNRRKALLVGSLELSAWGFHFHTELSAGVGRVAAGDSFTHYDELESFPVDVTGRLRVVSSELYSPYFRFNFPGSGEAEVQTPKSAWLTYAWDNGSIGFYKEKKEWGVSYLGNYIYDRHISSYSTATLKFFNRIFDIDISVMFPYSYLGGSAKSYTMEYRRLFLSHRIQVRILRNLSLALSENVMYWIRDGFEPLFTNPALIFHNNVEDNLFNAIAHVELEYVPFKGLRLYSQIGVDQGSVPFFEDESKEDLAAGFTFGSEYVFLIDDAVASAGIECALVTPAMYRRGKQHPDFIIADIATMNDDSYTMVPFFTYMGFPYGGDTFAARIGFDYRKGRLYTALSSVMIWKGEQSFLTPLTVPSGLSLTGDIRFGMYIEASAEYRMDIGKFPLSLRTVVDGVFDEEKGFDLQVTVGASISATARLSVD